MNFPPRSAVMALALPFLKAKEGFRSHPYKDGGGVPTIGYGTTVYPGGKHVDMADEACTEPQASAWLESHAGDALDFLEKKISFTPTPHQLAAMLCLAYNIGTGAFANSTLLRRFNAGETSAASLQFLVWDKINGDTSIGLLARRQMEKAMFDGGMA